MSAIQSPISSKKCFVFSACLGLVMTASLNTAAFAEGNDCFLENKKLEILQRRHDKAIQKIERKQQVVTKMLERCDRKAERFTGRSAKKVERLQKRVVRLEERLAKANIDCDLTDPANSSTAACRRVDRFTNKIAKIEEKITTFQERGNPALARCTKRADKGNELIDKFTTQAGDIADEILEAQDELASCQLGEPTPEPTATPSPEPSASPSQAPVEE